MSLPGFASDGVYPANIVANIAVRSYRTFSPFPAVAMANTGGLFSVALSLRLPSLAVSQHPDPVKPGLSSRQRFCPAAIQPSNLPL